MLQIQRGYCSYIWSKQKTKTQVPQIPELPDFVYFDKCILSASTDKVAMISSNKFSSGKHEWIIEILKCDVSLQEIGIVSCDIMIII